MSIKSARPRQPPVPVSVVIPTVGRVDLLARCLESIAACDPLPGEVVVVDQSGDSGVSELVDRFGNLGAGVVTSDRRNIALGTNLGLRSARHDFVLVTHDDCRVARSWVGVGYAHLAASPEAIITGRVVAGGDPHAVPSTKDDPEPRDFTGESAWYVLFANNMGFSRSAVLDFGGFDERFESAAEDNDLCYRGLRAGRTLRYEPDLVVWHEDWRTPDELKRVYAGYARAQGLFYAKHLWQGDPHLLREFAGDLIAGVREPRRPILPWLPIGLVEGWWRFSKRPSLRGRK
jgi:GT2 family glycosyltransferase